MFRSLVLSMVVGASAVALAGGAAPVPVAHVVRLEGDVGADMIRRFKDEVAQATAPAPVAPIAEKGEAPAKGPGHKPATLFILDLRKLGGPLASVVALGGRISELDERNLRTVALLHEPPSGASTLLALACDQLYMTPKARLGPLDPSEFAEPKDPEGAKTLKTALARYGEQKKQGRPGLALLHQAFVDPEVNVLAVKPKGHKGRFVFIDGDKRAGSAALYDKVVAAGNRGKRLELDAEKALEIEISDATVDSVWDVAEKLGIAGENLFGTMGEKPAKGKGAAAAKGPTKKPEKPSPIGPIRETGPVVFITLSGMVGDGMFESVKRRLKEARKLNPGMIVFEIDTFGGKLGSAFDVGKEIFDVRDVRTVAYVNDKAISAGSFIAVACDQIVMRRGSTMGDCQIVTGEGKPLKLEKYESPLRARFRNFCEGKYPIALAMAMVTEDLKVYELETVDGEKKYLTDKELKGLTVQQRRGYKNAHDPKLIIAKGELLTMTDTEAKDYGFSRDSVSSRKDILKHYELSDREIVEIEWSWSERFVRYLDMFGTLLLTLGILGVIIELKTPGFGIFGIAGLILIGVFFLGKHAAGLAEVWEILLFFVGLGLLAVEVFITPGFGLMGLAGLLCMLSSVILSLQSFTIPHKDYEWAQFHWSIAQLGIVSFGVLAGVFLISRYLHKVPYFGKIVLAQLVPSTVATSVTESVSPPPPAEAEAQRIEALVGKRGQAVTMLRPAGRAELDGEPLDVVTEGDFIEPGAPIEVLAVRGNRVVVRRAT